jgi:hypothetical protein
MAGIVISDHFLITFVRGSFPSSRRLAKSWVV